MLDQLLAFGASFDWVTPLVDLYKDLNNGPHHDFYIDRYAGWSAGKIRRLLKRHGVRLWGLSYTEDLIIFRVRETQAQWTQYLLLQENIPILGGLIEKSGNRHPQSKTQHRSTKTKDRKNKNTDPLDAIDNWLDDLGKLLGL